MTVENLAPCKKLVRVELEPKAVDTAFDQMTSNYQRQAALPGFRAGKAPRHMVLQRYAADIEQEVKRKLISESYQKALKDNQINVVGYPDIEEIQFGRSLPLQFAATVETAPEFEVPDYKNLTIKRETASVTDADVERAVNVLREQRVTYTDVTRPVANGDFVVVNYTGTCDGKPVTETAPTARGLTEQKNFWIEIKPGSFIPGFTEQLIGRSAGEKQTVNVDFPADFVAAQLSGKKGQYEVEVVHVKVKVLPELDDEFAKSFGAENVAKLNEGVRADLENELKYKQARVERNQIVEQLMKAVSFDLPETVVQNETRSVVYDLVRENQQRGVPKEAIEEQKDQLYNFAAASAKDRVKAMFLLSKIAALEHVKVEQQELAQRVYALAQQQQVPIEKFAKQLDEQGGYGQIQQQLLVEKILSQLHSTAKVEEVPAGSLNPEKK